MALAETQWQKDHPRREQVNSRLNNQNNRIDNKVDSGKMTKSLYVNKLHFLACFAMFPPVWLTLPSRRGMAKVRLGKYLICSGGRWNH